MNDLNPLAVLTLITFAVIVAGLALVIAHDYIAARDQEPLPAPLTTDDLTALIEDGGQREQRVLANLAEWGSRSEWTNGVARAKTRAYLPDGKAK